MSIFDQLTADFTQRAQQQGLYDAYAQSRGAPPLSPDQQPGFLSRLLGAVTNAPISGTSTFGAIPGGMPAAPASGASAPQGGGFFSSLFGGAGGQQPPAGTPLNLQPPAPQPAPVPAQPAPSAPQPFNMAPMPAAQPAARPTFPSVIDNTPTGTIGGGGPAGSAPAFAPAPSGALPTFAAAGGAPGQDNTSRALAFYQSKGLSPLAASALVGGFHAESGSGLNTSATNVGDGTDGSNSVGIAQWNGDRARGLQQFAAANGLDPRNIDTQLQYSWLELNGSEKGTLQALQSAQNPAQATAAALGYERPAGWSAANPYGAKTFGARLKNTVGLASNGFNTPFDGSAIGPNPNGFTPDPQGAGGLPTFAASGQGMSLPQATPLSRLLAQQPSNSVGSGTAASGQDVPTDAAGNALGPDGRPTALSYAGGAAPVAAAPASRAISAAAPAGDPLVSVPGYSGTWNKAKIAAAPDGTDVPDDGELARAQGAGAAPDAVQVPRGTSGVPLPAVRAPSPIAGQPAPAPTTPPVVPAASATSGFSITPELISALMSNPNTQAFGAQLWQHALTAKAAAPNVVHPGDVILDANNRPLYQIPNKPDATDAIKNFQFAQSQGYQGSFTDYQSDQQKGDKSSYVDVPLPDGRMQKMAGVPGSALSTFTPIGAPYVPKPGTSVSIDTKAESSQEGEYGKAVGIQLGEVMKAGFTAPQALNQVAMLRAAAARAGDNLSTGPFGPVALKAKQAIGNALGMEIPGTSEGEVINNIGYGLATQAARAISNRPTQMEFANALSVKPGLSLSPQGMTAVLNIRQQDLQDQIALAKLASVKANRDNWSSTVADYYATHPVMSPFDPTRPLGAQDVQAINGSQQAAPMSSQDRATSLSAARAAIAGGAPRDAVISRLRQGGIDPSGL